VFDQDGDERFSFMAFDPAFRGGVRVALGDINGDGTPDIVAASSFACVMSRSDPDMRIGRPHSSQIA
jgi:hypothetical protein